MGIHDRDYIRDKPLLGGPGDAGSGGILGSHPAIAILIGINFVVWVAWQAAIPSADGPALMLANFAASREALSQLYFLGLITSCFSHYEFRHLALNMIFLWWAARAAEEFFGSRNFFALYVICGWFGAIVHVIILPTFLVGASGAVIGMIVIAALLDPHRSLSFLGIFRVSVGRVAIGFVLVTVLLLVLDPMQTIGDLTHLAGALAGYLCYRFDLRPFRHSGQSALIARFRARPVAGKDVPPTTGGGTDNARPPGVDGDTAARMEALLDKISREGIDSLSDEEKAFLAEASKKYRG